MAEKDGNVKISLTITPATVAWLDEMYPDALDRQHAIRHAISDARLFREHLDVLGMADGGIDE